MLMLSLWSIDSTFTEDVIVAEVKVMSEALPVVVRLAKSVV